MALTLVRKYGITEYWCSKEFDPSEDFPVGSVFLLTDDAAPELELYDLYTRMEEYTDECCPAVVSMGAKDSETFNIATNDLERREVNQVSESLLLFTGKEIARIIEKTEYL